MKFLSSLFLAGALTLSAKAPATNCGIEREGTFIPFSGQQQFLLTCWVVEFDTQTQFKNAQGELITFDSIPQGGTVTAEGCLKEDGFTLLADKVTYQSPDPTLMVSDVQVILGRNERGLFIQHISDKTAGLEGPENVSPTITLEVGKRYLFSYPHMDDPLGLGSVKSGNAGWNEPLLIQGQPFGEFESGHEGIEWVDNGTDVYFTLTQELADAMEGNINQVPGFCLTFQQENQGKILFNAKSAIGDWTAY